jgi:collagenase-like PrtC family protease
MMELSVPTNWDDRLLDLIFARDTRGRITEIYGKLPLDETGGGRPAFPLAFVSRRAAGRHIRRVRGKGLRFNYLLNALCMDNREFTRRGQNRLERLLDWVVSAGANQVTVANPYVCMWIRKHYPGLAVSVSAVAGANTVSRALFWESLGACSITFPSTAVNRDIQLIKRLRRAVTCRIQLIATNACALSCPLFDFHYLANAHASQSRHRSGGFFLDHHMIRCRLARLKEPGRFIRSDWIRPEDSAIYEGLGVDSLKLTDRRLSTAVLDKITGVYLDRSYEGDILGLFSTFCGVTSLEHKGIARKALAMLAHLPEVLSARRFSDCFARLEAAVDNRALDGFIAGLPDACSGRDCGPCDYCATAAQRAVTIDENYRAAAVRRLEGALDELARKGL